MLSDMIMKRLVWLCAILFCILIWVQVIMYVTSKLTEIDETKREVQEIKERLSQSSTVTVGDMTVRFE